MSEGPLRSVKDEGVELWQRGEEEETGVVQGWTILGWVTGRLGATGTGSSLGWTAALLMFMSSDPSTFTFTDLPFSWFSTSPPL